MRSFLISTKAFHDIIEHSMDLLFVTFESDSFFIARIESLQVFAPKHETRISRFQVTSAHVFKQMIQIRYDAKCIVLKGNWERKVRWDNWHVREILLMHSITHVRLKTSLRISCPLKQQKISKLLKLSSVKNNHWRRRMHPFNKDLKQEILTASSKSEREQ